MLGSEMGDSDLMGRGHYDPEGSWKRQGPVNGSLKDGYSLERYKKKKSYIYSANALNTGLWCGIRRTCLINCSG